jgi:hypothetical protein
VDLKHVRAPIHIWAAPPSYLPCFSWHHRCRHGRGLFASSEMDGGAQVGFCRALVTLSFPPSVQMASAQKPQTICMLEAGSRSFSLTVGPSEQKLNLLCMHENMHLRLS